MVVLEVDGSLSVAVTRAAERRCAYAVVYEGEEVARYETSADPRTTGGRVGLRNVVCTNVPDYEKAAVGERLAVAVDENAGELAEELGSR